MATRSRRVLERSRSPKPILYSLEHAFYHHRRVKLYLLDRDVISLIKRKNAGATIEAERPTAMLAKLESLDAAENFFSPMVAIIEGNRSRRDSAEEISKEIIGEAGALSQFFQRARTDGEYIRQLAEAISNMPNGLKEIPYRAYIDFVQTMMPKVVQSTSKAHRHLVQAEILDGALRLGIPPTHPIVLCFLSTLYGCSAARRVLKPSETLKSGNWENPVNDALVVSRLGQLIALDPDVDFGFLTLDRGLDESVKFFRIESADHRFEDAGSEHVRIAIKSTIRHEMFPELPPETVNSLVSQLDSLSNPGDDLHPASP